MSGIRQGDIPPNHGGTIKDPGRNDVLSGRGGRINAHPGNVKFRELVKEYRPIYLSNETKKLDKVKIAARIVEIIRSSDPSGRFLKEEKGAWTEIGDEKARKKAGQAMREKAEDFRREQGQIHQQQHNIATSPQQMLPAYQSPNSSSPSSQSFVQPGNHPYHQISQQNQQSLYPQAGMMSMPHMQQMNFQHHVPSAQLPNLDIRPVGSSDSLKRHPGLMTGNAVAFNREFNRMSSSESGNGRSSVNVSSMGSINTSMSSTNKSSMSSRSRGSEVARQVEVMEAINDVREDSIASGWDDSWDQGPSAKDCEESVKSVESERRKNMFRNMKNESSCLPSTQLTVTDNVANINENELMKESLVSVEMQSMEMKKSVNFLDKSIQMDSINELIVDTLNSEEDMHSGESFSLTSEERRTMMQGNEGIKRVGSVLEKPKHQVRGISGISSASAVSAMSDGGSWAAIENNHSTLPDLPTMGLTDSARQNAVSDYSSNSQSNVQIESQDNNRARICSDFSNK